MANEYRLEVANEYRVNGKRAFYRCGTGALGLFLVLIARVWAEAGTDASFLLLSAPEATEYYPKIGLEAVANGWMWKRLR